MKKRILAAMLTISLAFGLVGCGESYGYTTYTSTTQTNVGDQIGRFIVLENEGSYKDENAIWHNQYLVYDKDTFVIYVYDISYNDDYYRRATGTAMTEFYCIDADGNPQVAIYNGDEEF